MNNEEGYRMGGLQVIDLEVTYGQALALKTVSLRVESKAVVGLVGPNGAGKTTLLRSISGVIAPKNGRIVWEGVNVTGLRASAIVKKGVAHVPEGRRLFPDLTVLDNIRIGAVIAGKPVAERLELIFGLFPVLKERINQVAGTLSGGEQQMVAISRSLLAEPRLLLVDEMSFGLAPITASSLIEVLLKLNRRDGLTVLIVDQNLSLLRDIVTSLYVLAEGQIQHEFKGGEIDDIALIQSYMGRD